MVARMAARTRRTTSRAGNDLDPPKLLLSREQAKEALQDRIARGLELRARAFGSEGQLVAAREDRTRWSDYNVELLTRMFDNASEADRYARPGLVIGYLGETFEESVTRFYEYMDTRINRLASLMERLDLIPEAGQKANPPEAVAKDAIDAKDVFVVHGRDEEAKQTVARFLEKLGLRAVILHEQANRGLTLIEKIERNAASVGFVVVLLTPDDSGGLVGTETRPRARQNVIFELGWFIGKLGRDRVCALKKGEVEIPTDYPVAFVPLDTNGGWRQEMARELRAAGISFDYNRALL